MQWINFTAPPKLVIVFEEIIYEVTEDIGLDNFALRVCLTASNVRAQTNVTLSTLSIDSAKGK